MKEICDEQKKRLTHPQCSGCGLEVIVKTKVGKEIKDIPYCIPAQFHPGRYECDEMNIDNFPNKLKSKAFLLMNWCEKTACINCFMKLENGQCISYAKPCEIKWEHANMVDAVFNFISEKMGEK